MALFGTIVAKWLPTKSVSIAIDRQGDKATARVAGVGQVESALLKDQSGRIMTAQNLGFASLAIVKPSVAPALSDWPRGAATRGGVGEPRVRTALPGRRDSAYDSDRCPGLRNDRRARQLAAVASRRWNAMISRRQINEAPVHLTRANARGTESSQTRRWREMDSNHRYPGDKLPLRGRSLSGAVAEVGAASELSPAADSHPSPGVPLGLRSRT